MEIGNGIKIFSSAKEMMEDKVKRERLQFPSKANDVKMTNGVSWDTLWLQKAISERYSLVGWLFQIVASNMDKYKFMEPTYIPIIAPLFKDFFPLPEALMNKKVPYFGHVKNGKAHGRGRVIMPDNSKYDGDWKYDYYDGEGKYQHANGDLYEGQFHQGLMHGHGEYKYASGGSYRGSWHQGKMHGFGNLINYDKTTYSGDWVHGKRQGKGKYIWTSGDIYEGAYFNDVKHGNGKLMSPSGAIYEGSFVNDIQEGQGKYAYPDGGIYTGELCDYRRHGKGTHFYANGGGKYSGDWVMDKREGYGTMRLNDPQVLSYSGAYKNDSPNGWGTALYKSGARFEGQFENGKAHGRGRETLKCGKVNHDGMFKFSNPCAHDKESKEYIAISLIFYENFPWRSEE